MGWLGYDIKLNLAMRLQFGGSGVWITPLLQLLPDPLWYRVVVTVKVPSIDLFKNYSYSIRLWRKKEKKERKKPLKKEKKKKPLKKERKKETYWERKKEINK